MEITAGDISGAKKIATREQTASGGNGAEYPGEICRRPWARSWKDLGGKLFLGV